MRALLSLLPALYLGACVSMAGETNEAPEPQPAGASPTLCGAEKVAGFVGRSATSEVRSAVEKAVGHASIRWIGPGDAVTMDFSESRLNAELDQAGKIVRFRCG